METPETIAPVQAVETPPAMDVPEAQPWLQECPALQLERPVETIHWSIVALTALTALSVLFGSYGRASSEPRELLPIVVYAR